MSYFKKLLDENNVNYSFSNISTKDTKSYKYTIYMLKRVYNFVETDNYIMLESVPQVPVIKLDKDYSLLEFINRVRKTKEEIKNDKTKWLFF